ncbi:hypothetical protein [Clostridium cellulovorans]|nr:hypothetical protein [Clostridium cellulovorans]
MDISSERSDQLRLMPFNTSSPKKFSNVIADVGYDSEENYAYL